MIKEILLLLFKKEIYLDTLTGCQNKNFFINERKEMERNSLCLIIDIDYFKRINDNLGHDEGDIVLQKVAQIIMNNVRGSDVIRFGGDEFVVFLRASIQDARIVAERIRAVVEEKTTVTVSVGIGWGFSEADKKMYIAKKKRNVVEY